LAHRNPGALTVPTYLPKICSTFASFGLTRKNPAQPKTSSAKTTIQRMTMGVSAGGRTAETKP